MALTADFVPLFSQRDPIPDLYVAPPLTRNSFATCLEKMALVKQIADAYQSIRVTSETQPCCWNVNARGVKHITGWSHGLLYTMSKKSLRYLIENPDVAEHVCDDAKAFDLLYSGHKYMSRYHVDFSFARSDTADDSVVREMDCDSDVCAISRKRGGVVRTFILPPQASYCHTSLLLYEGFWQFVTVIFGAPIADRVESLLKRQHREPRQSENSIWLSPSLSDLFDAGVVGLRPLAVTRRPLPGDGEAGMYSVHFSVHRMHQHGVHNANEYRRDARSALESMLTRASACSPDDDKVGETDAVTQQPILDGDERAVHHVNYENAENMFILLAFRWTVTMALCLAGALRIRDDEVASVCEATVVLGSSDEELSDEGSSDDECRF